MDNLKEFGYNFQVKVLTLLLKDRTFLTNMIDRIKEEYFDNKSVWWIAENIFKYFDEFKVTPTLDVFKVQLNNIKVELHRKEVVAVLKDVYKNFDSTDLGYVSNEISTFVQRQELKNAIYRCVDYISENKFDEIKHEIDNAYKKTLTKDKSLVYLQDIDYRYTKEAEKERIETGWEPINEIMGGGLPKGKLGVVMAPTGIGKTWILCHIGASALKAGKRVLHYTLELDDVYTAHRYDTIITGIPMTDLPYNVDKVKKKLETITKGSLIIEERPPGTFTTTALEQSIEKYTALGMKPDIVILDYAELMQITFLPTIREDKTLGQHYTDLRGVASKHEFALWTADQTNRSGASKDIVEGDSISNAYAKLFVVDFLMTISRRPKDKEKNRARVFISKSRLGMDGISFVSDFNTSLGHIEVLDERTDEGRAKREDMNQQKEYEKDVLGDLYERFDRRNTKNLF
jgi:replicative DNA helicase